MSGKRIKCTLGTCRGDGMFIEGMYKIHKQRVHQSESVTEPSQCRTNSELNDELDRTYMSPIEPTSKRQKHGTGGQWL